MTRSRTLSLVLWSSLAGACGGDGVGHLPDAPVSGAPVASFAPTLATMAECGVAVPVGADLTVTNTGTADLVISAATADSGFTVTTTLPLTIAAGAHASVTVQPPVSVIGTDIGGATKTGTLTLDTNESATPVHTVNLTATVLGANIAFTDVNGAPITAMLTDATGACPAPLAVFIHNSGTEPLTIGVGSASGFAFDGFSGGTVAAGGVVTQDIRPFTQGGCSGAAAITYQLTGMVCAGPTATLQATFNITGTSSCFCS
jgi:hypothetical protein